MARLPRLALPGYPHHVIQRGNNRQAIFGSSEDRFRMLALLEEHARRQKVAVHAYVLMGNHFHLLVTPDTEDGLPQMMQAVGRSYVRYYNDRHARSGTLWEGRYRSTVVQTERYLMACMAYIDLNPVRAGLALSAAEYAWSSHGHYLGHRVDRLISPHALYWALGNTPFAREIAYAEWVAAGIAASHQQALTDATLKGWVLGSPDFVAQLQARTPRRVTPRHAGRPAGLKKN
ncbi:MAG: transposase [Rhodoferax sp.]|nr:transposase [Rhodoferax sp.]